MSTFGVIEQRRQKKRIEDLNPGQALRHQGNYCDTYVRMQATLRLADSLGQKGIEKVGPYLPRFIADDRNLRAAWDHMRQYGGRSVGPDEQQLLTIHEQSILPHLKEIQSHLSSGGYRATEEDEYICRIPKGPGRGERHVTIQDQGFRLAQRAALQILDPLLDSKLDDRCFGGRLRRGPHLALATAEQLFLDEGRKVWVTEDLRDAFCCVPIARLLQILAKHIPDKDTIKLVRGMLVGSRTPGLRQGGALSPLLLAIYLEHVLTRKWRKRHPDIPLLLYIDDILILCRSTEEARMARQSLDELLNGTGMHLKGTEKNSVRELISSRPAEWLGYQIRKESGELVIQVPDMALDRLGGKVKLAIEADESLNSEPVELRLRSVLDDWVNYYAPCIDSLKGRQWTFARIDAMLRSRKLPRFNFDTFNDFSRDAIERWEAVCQRVSSSSKIKDGNEVVVPEWLFD